MRLERVFSRIFRGILYLPKTIYINFRTLPIKEAIKFPYIVMGSCSFKGVNKSNIRIEGKVKTGMIKLAAQKTSKRGIHVNRKAYLIVDDGGSISFNGNASIGAGTSICAKGGEICFGNSFSCNVNCFIYSQKRICFGNDVLMGWNVNFRDNDGHPMYDSDGNLTNPDKLIEISDHVWIASYVDVIKGVSLASGTIVGTRSLVTRSNEIANAIIAGIPARVIKKDIYWEHGE